MTPAEKIALNERVARALGWTVRDLGGGFACRRGHAAIPELYCSEALAWEQITTDYPYATDLTSIARAEREAGLRVDVNWTLDGTHCNAFAYEGMRIVGHAVAPAGNHAECIARALAVEAALAARKETQ